MPAYSLNKKQEELLSETVYLQWLKCVKGYTSQQINACRAEIHQKNIKINYDNWKEAWWRIHQCGLKEKEAPFFYPIYEDLNKILLVPNDADAHGYFNIVTDVYEKLHSRNALVRELNASFRISFFQTHMSESKKLTAFNDRELAMISDIYSSTLQRAFNKILEMDMDWNGDPALFRNEIVELLEPLYAELNDSIPGSRNIYRWMNHLLNAVAVITISIACIVSTTPLSIMLFGAASLLSFTCALIMNHLAGKLPYEEITNSSDKLLHQVDAIICR